MKISEQLLLQFLLLTSNISFWVLVSAINLKGLLQRSSSRFKKFTLGYLVVGSSFIWKKRKISWNGHSLTFVVTPWTTCCHSLSLVVICCHSLSVVATRCTTRLSFYKRSPIEFPAFCHLKNISLNVIKRRIKQSVKSGQSKLFKGCLLQNLLSPLLNALSQIVTCGVTIEKRW